MNLITASFAMRKNLIVILNLLCIVAYSATNDTLTQHILLPEDAVRLGLEKNLGIQISQNDVEKAIQKKEAGVGLFLPDVNASIVETGTIENPDPTSSLGISSNWVLFDGFNSYHTYRLLQSQESSLELTRQLEMEELIKNILTSYYKVVTDSIRVRSLKEQIAVSSERTNIAQNRYAVGASSKMEYLQALSDYHTDSIAYLSQIESLKEAKYQLNLLLARDATVDYSVIDTVLIDTSLPLQDWENKLLTTSRDALYMHEQNKSATLQLEQQKSRVWPSVSAGLGYSTKSNNSNPFEGAPTVSEGTAYRLNLNVPIFNRLETRRDILSSKIDVRSSHLRIQQAEQQVKSDFATHKIKYTSALVRMALTEKNLEVARQQAQAAHERYLAGASTSLEFRDAQLKLLDANTRHVLALADAKISEVSLKRISGKLLQTSPTTSN